jgi:type II restriction/modification system DNA methylase subunit YeeA
MNGCKSSEEPSVNTAQLKSYAPEARRTFIAAVSAQAAKLGISEKDITSAQIQGDVLLIGGQALPASYDKPRKLLIEQIKARGFDRTMEAIAYTWFNRFVAIRYMELHGYLEHGYRILSHPESQGRPEILDHVADVDLPGLDREKAIELKLDGTKDEELYRLLLLAQCNALHQAMPFLFEKIGDETELLLPVNLLHTDSLIRHLVESIDEELWGEIEIIGWLYQFYISEKKDQVIGKVVKSEDIPAATQLFTPNWIVKYMVQNSLGAQWLATYPQSPLKGQMEYYIEPAEQAPEVQHKLREITPDSLDPETMTLIDPASGSGHILVEAYELFRPIYLERGYRQRDVPEKILQKNLFGLDIDDRAAQLTGFALMMKGRADDRQLFGKEIKLNVMALVDSAGFDAEKLVQDPTISAKLAGTGLQPGDLTELKLLFEHATTFGSLIQVPEGLAKKLPALKQLSEETSQDLFVSEALKRLEPLVQQAEMLAAQYDAVVANPPYMGSKFHLSDLKNFLRKSYADVKSDLFSAFIVRSCSMGLPNARIGMMSPNVWMYISSHEGLREFISSKTALASLVELPLSGFKGATVQICSFTLRKAQVPNALGGFIQLTGFKGGDREMATLTRQAIANRDCGWFFEAAQGEFKKIPGSPIAYWISDALRSAFAADGALQDYAQLSCGMFTCNNERFIRYWWEVAAHGTQMFGMQGGRWVSHVKGASGARWSKAVDSVVDFSRGGDTIREYRKSRGQSYCLPGEQYFFRAGVSFPLVTSGTFSAVSLDGRSTFDISSNSAFPSGVSSRVLLAALCSNSTTVFVEVLCPTVNFTPGDVGKIPLLWDRLSTYESDLERIATECIGKTDVVLQSFETAGGFQSLAILTAPTLESSYTAWITQNKATVAEMKRLEEENNRLFIDAYGLQDELTPDVPIEQITLTVNPAYRYGAKLTEEQLWNRFRQDSMAEFVSYAIGCMMGRYSLDAPGLIYANSGNEGFDPSKYPTFPADDDGIVPLTDTEWFEDDASHRLVEFIDVTFKSASDGSRLEGNLTFLADNLSPKKAESSRDTIRRYLCDKFFKDHLQTYKKRPIYWLFSSGKQKAFQCLVYLHRYNEGTLSRMRSEYVIPLQGKMAARLEQLQGDIQAATSTSHQKRLTKEREKLAKQQVELLTFDEKLRHYADMRISLDLDDGVKVNYGKFGDLLAEVKAIHGKNPESV